MYRIEVGTLRVPFLRTLTAVETATVLDAGTHTWATAGAHLAMRSSRQLLSVLRRRRSATSIAWCAAQVEGDAFANV